MKESLVLETNESEKFLEAIRQRIKSKTFFGLRGDMGAGKTTLIGHLLRDQNVDVSSPTFALYNSYKAFGLSVIHVDLYRLESAEDVDSAGFWDLFADDQSIVLAEWVERVSVDELPLDWQKWFIQINVLPDGKRKYSLFSFV
ncbi:MAG: tRNA (adenosine(37)-N6)-threonylcarbamoyltransferase complex ATPase subunit type 1 TsaE [Bdellovibrionaceae bacterium]|nr:tRNA (adenosine(37)-N6)-threonylcarbamoyltransferase complex ATPase subunit type 1 TsaE [Pseudobdellovibrionaceae bacterium]